MDAEYEARLQRELDELKNMEQFERDVREHVTRIREVCTVFVLAHTLTCIHMLL